MGTSLLAGVCTSALAQQRSAVADSAASAGASPAASAPGHQYAQAEIMGPDGKPHYVYVRPNPNGYAGMLAFHRTAEATRRGAAEPLSISVDKVKWMKVAGLYQEHMVLKGKPQRIIATRLIDGPVELFNHTQVDPMVVPVPGAGLVTAVVAGAVAGGAMAAAGAGGIKERHWYLRRNGELLKVSRVHFVEQLTDYFQDDAEVVAALQREQVRYPDMVAVVEAYNRHRAAGLPAAR
ncbi:hypothetical protein [Hymenobacter nivis]|uniref:Uncharacterized protein n=1 Tax=Hymenobacter nivis TaxID=1850093 RepID=A0A502HCZ8_9BACT|nr:hypothetical protein [Hymenobacter nivis]TPG72401.1 hypothetical protein EAH73_04020 [Hymenobacter nivis]